MISLALPTGSLEKATLGLFDDAGLTVRRPANRSCRGTVDHPAVTTVAFFKPREIPHVVADGTFTLGLTGSDWIEESGAKVEAVHALGYSKKTDTGWRLALAVPDEHPVTTVNDLPAGTRIASEYPALTRSWLSGLDLGEELSVVHSWGSTEGKIPELADAVVEVVETGTSLRHNRLREVQTVRHCVPTVIAAPAAWAEPRVRAAIDSLTALLRGAASAGSHRLLTVVVPRADLARAAALLPARRWRLDASDDGLAVVQTAVASAGLGELLTGLLDAGAVQVLDAPIGTLVTA